VRIGRKVVQTMDKFCADCIHNEVCQYGAIPPHIGRCNDKDTLDDLIPHGEWINHRNDNGHNIADCSECGKTMQWHDEDEDGIPRYCWYCGAKMERGNKND
jgi:hypothetical protein